MTKAISYIRFSSEKQADGDSKNRQLKAAREYATSHNLELDDSTYQDLGISAFKGKNLSDGALGAFIEALRIGKIQRGTVLIVESLDRLSRLPVNDALRNFQNIIHLGAVIVTLHDNQIYDTKSINDNWTKLIIALAVMARANEESKIKGSRIKDSWDARRKAGGIITGVCPSWLTRDGDKWKLIPQKVQVVEKIFKLALDGNGTPAIARILNEEEVPTMVSAKEWTFGPIAAILKNEAVIGTLVSKKGGAEPILNYYPAIITEELFKEVRARVSGRKWVGGRSTLKVNNLFTGYSYCIQCGGRMRAVSGNKLFSYVRCQSAYSGGACKAEKISYEAVEECILKQFHAQNRDLIPTVESLPENIQASLSAELHLEQTKLNRMLDLFEATGGDVGEITTRMKPIREKIAELKAAMAALTSTPTIKAGQIRRWWEEMGTVDGEERTELRLKIQASIRRFLKKVEFDHVGTVQLTYASGKVRVMDFKEYLRPKGFQPGNKNGKRV